MILSGYDILKYMSQGMLRIEPFDMSVIRENGVDLRIADEIAVQKESSIIFNSLSVEDAEKYMVKMKCGEYIRIPARKFVLATTLETVRLSASLVGFCCLRSTWARMGLMIPPTIIDAGFEGQLTIEIYNAGEYTVSIPVGSRFLHVVFSTTTGPCIPYAGKYQHQKGVTLPKKD